MRVTPDVLQHQFIQSFPTDRMGCTALLTIVLIYPAGESGVLLFAFIIADIQRGTTVRTFHQPSEGLYLPLTIFSAPGIHHLMHRIPQFLRDQRLMCILRDHPFFLRGCNTRFIKESFCLCPAKYHLSQISPIIENGTNRCCMPVIRFTPIVTIFVVVRIILVEVRLRVQNIPFPQDLCHPYIAYSVSEHPENFSHYISCRRIDNQMVAVIGIFQIPEGSAAPKEHSRLCSGPVCGLGLAGCLSCVEGIDHIGEGQYQIVHTILGVNVLGYRDEPDALLLKVVFDVHSHLRVLSTEAGQVFDDDHIDFSRLNVIQHSFEVRPVEVGSAPSVIAVVITNGNVAFITVLSEQCLLRLDAAGFSCVAIILTEAAVNARCFIFHIFYLLFSNQQYRHSSSIAISECTEDSFVSSSILAD